MTYCFGALDETVVHAAHVWFFLNIEFVLSITIYVLCPENEMAAPCVIIICIFLKINGYLLKVKCLDHLYDLPNYVYYLFRNKDNCSICLSNLSAISKLYGIIKLWNQRVKKTSGFAVWLNGWQFGYSRLMIQ